MRKRSPNREIKPQQCRECGCTQGNACVTVSGTCGWAKEDLCTACDELDQRGARLMFGELRLLNLIRCTEYFHALDEWSPTDWATAVAGEVGEACNLIKKLRRGEAVHAETIGKELADAVIYLDLLAARLGLNLAQCVQQKFNEVSKRRGAPYRL